MSILFKIYAFCGCVYWLGFLFMMMKFIRSVPRLENSEYKDLENWPSLSVIAPARNEARSIKAAITSRLKDDYPNLEIIIVDDRSDDGTSEIVDELADGDSRVKVIHIKELPEGWLGKVHAMHRGVQQASGQWLLFSDADVFVKPGAMKRIISYSESQGLDHLAIFPEFFKTSFFLDTAIALFTRYVSIMIRFMKFEDDESEGAAGAGAFNLVRRSMFEKTKGFEWLKLDIADDMALGLMLKKAGARRALVNGSKYVGVILYNSLKGLALGLERLAFVPSGDPALMEVFFRGTFLLVMEMSPFIVIIYYPFMGLAMVIMAFFTSALINKWANRPVLTSLFIPVGAVLMSLYTFRAGIISSRRNGIVWRGTFYPTKAVKEGRRFNWGGP